MEESKGPGGSGNGSETGIQKVKKKAPYNLKSAIRSALRRAWRENPALQDVLKREKIYKPFYTKKGKLSSKPRVFFKCYVCKEEKTRKEVSVDHIEPVGPTPGSKLAPVELTWDTFIARMFCDTSNLGTICEVCHRKKTNAETTERFRRLHEAG